MSDPVTMMVTNAGLAALVDADAVTPIVITQVGLTQSAFVMAPTIDALPGEFKRLTASFSGDVVGDTLIHMTATDGTADIYDLCGMALYLDDGTLFAVYSQPTPIFRKVSVAVFLLALDVAFANGTGNISFGPALFLLPPSTESVAGLARIATNDEADAGTDDQTIISPKKLQRRLAALAGAIGLDVTALSELIAALTARTITGSGLVTGGGSLAASRVLGVAAALASDVAAGVANDMAVTPASLSGLARSLASNGYAVLPGTGGIILQWGRFSAISNTTSSALFPLTFPAECFAVIPAGGTSGGADSQDNPPVLIEGSITPTGFSVFSADETSAWQRYIALGV